MKLKHCQHINKDGTQCNKPYAAKGYCNGHYKHMQRKGYTQDLIQQYGPEHIGKLRMGRPKVAVPEYRGAHMRVYAERGKASEYECMEGCGKQAQEWAYCHCTDEAITDAKTGRLYSLDVDSYVALCKSCHRLFDLEYDPHYREGWYGYLGGRS